MKLLIAIVLLILLAIGGFVFTSNQAAAPTDQDTGVPQTESELEADTTGTGTGTDADASVETETTDTGVTATTEIETDMQVAATPAQTFTLDSFNYGYSMDEIRVPAGTEVTINLTNSGGFHDWVVDEFGAATEKISAGGSTAVTFTADKAGTYEYYCSVGNHRAQGMVGTLIVE